MTSPPSSSFSACAAPDGAAPAAPRLTAFAGLQCVARGAQHQLLAQLHARSAAPDVPVLVFNDLTGALVDVDLRPQGSLPVVPDAPASPPTRTVGRPRLGVVAREVTLLQRHWDWLNRQPGGASVALRKLVEEARRIHHGQDIVRESREAAYRFMSAIASNLEGFEEAARALFAGDQTRFAALVAPWPEDVGTYLQTLAAASWSGDAAR